MTDRETFLAACLDQPADDTVRLVYADLLREQDSPVGRFLWAGVALSRYRGQVVTDGDFFAAQKELNDSAPQVIGTQLEALFGWQWGDVLWDQDAEAADRLTAAYMPHKRHASERLRNLPQFKRKFPAVIYERGMICGLRMSLPTLRVEFGAVLRNCPLERVEVLDVPGLTLRIVQEPDRWLLVGELKLRRLAGSPSLLAALNPRVAYDTITEPWSHPTRAGLVEYIATAIDDTLDLLRSQAGDRWPGPVAVADFAFSDRDPDEPQEDEQEEGFGGPIDSEDM